MVKTCRRVKELSRVGSVGDTQKSGSPASAADKRLQLPAGNPYSGCVGGGCMRPAFWEPSAYWVTKIQKHEFPELLRVESGHLTPSTWMNGLSFSPRKVWICISPWETSRPEVEFAVSFRAAPSFYLPPRPPWAHAHARNNLNLNPQPSRAPAAWSLTRPF